MRTFTLAVVLGSVSALVLLHGCGLDVTGYADQAEAGITPLDESGTTSGSTADASEGGASIDAPVDAPIESAPPACRCALDAPAGWTQVAYAGDRTKDCIGDLETANVIADPVAGAGACTCNTCNITQPTCGGTKWRTLKDDSGSLQCNQTSTYSNTANNDGTTCVKEDFSLANHAKLEAVLPQGGSCTAAVTKNAGAVTTTNARLCRPKGTTCACDPGLGATFKSCIAKRGDVACPQGAPNKHLVGTSADVACDPSCTCALTGTTCASTAAYYSNYDCSDSGLIFTVTTTCQTQPNGMVHSFRYTSTPTGATCNVGPAPVGKPSLADATTVCCP